MEQLNPEKIESYEKMQKSLNDIHILLKEAGLGRILTKQLVHFYIKFNCQKN
jgi:hypothetical protein